MPKRRHAETPLVYLDVDDLDRDFITANDDIALDSGRQNRRRLDFFSNTDVPAADAPENNPFTDIATYAQELEGLVEMEVDEAAPEDGTNEQTADGQVWSSTVGLDLLVLCFRLLTPCRNTTRSFKTGIMRRNFGLKSCYAWRDYAGQHRRNVGSAIRRRGSGTSLGIVVKIASPRGSFARAVASRNMGNILFIGFG